MIRKVLLAAVLFAAVLGFGSCSGNKVTDPSTSPFEGTWEGGDHESWTFSGNEFVEQYDRRDGIGFRNEFKGTFTYTNDTITFYRTHSWDSYNNQWEEDIRAADTNPYYIDGDTLFMEYHATGYMDAYQKVIVRC